MGVLRAQHARLLAGIVKTWGCFYTLQILTGFCFTRLAGTPESRLPSKTK
jgi:hypothetical protein